MNIRSSTLLSLAFGATILTTPRQAFTQGNAFIGATSIALGGNSVCLVDSWSLDNNPASMLELESAQLATFYSRLLWLDELSSQAFAFTFPFEQQSVGLFYRQYGFELYKEQTIGLSYGMRLADELSMGIQMNHFSIQSKDEYGGKSILSAKLGAFIQIKPDLVLGICIQHPRSSFIVEELDQKLLPLFQLGIRYQLQQNSAVYLQLDKEIQQSPALAIGIHQVLVKYFFLQLGYRTHSHHLSFGFGLERKRLSIDISSSFHQQLGFKPSLSLSYQLNSQDEE